MSETEDTEAYYFSCRLREPFPAINTTDEFICDRRTHEVIKMMFANVQMEKRGYRFDSIPSTLKTPEEQIVIRKHPDAKCIKEGSGYVIVINNHNDTLGIGETINEAWECAVLTIIYPED